ncbi:NADH dehydrogenase [Paenibacillus mucilaginosus 3016]|uniref:NADH dehydrogenase n=1 Tax=Paenibacillus mucilaginosus 3016 TaxID=1116391 RepID=H6N9P0_9BACL|nr:NAD(P)H-dependent oxidoreductase [Paenibacillus mucilaginosus]AFC28197.1 NADH dehydrogenase [Paenibacillus mucilaginosus 3016]WFA17021.1 flavodoxin family protein [Paenibacillus mucilaginosus]
MKVAVIVAHPDLTKSRANHALVQQFHAQSGVDVYNLYHEYPDWRIEVSKEQQRLLKYDRIVLQFPFYWYSCPPLLKKWFDDVFTYGWAFGTGGEHLKGKEFLVATTIASPEESYQTDGDNRFTIEELLRPIEQTIVKCHGVYLPFFAIYGVEKLTDAELAEQASRYAGYIQTPASN